jgi:hypothetical protein
MSKEENITRSKQNSSNQNGFDESMELGDSSKIATMSPPPFQLMASPVAGSQSGKAGDTTQIDSLPMTNTPEHETSGGGDPKPGRIGVKGKQKRNARKGGHQLDKGVGNGEFYGGNKTGVGFGGGKDPNLERNWERHPVDPMVPQTATLDPEMHDAPRSLEFNMPVDPGVDALESRTPSMELGEIREGRTVTMPAPKKGLKVPVTPFPLKSEFNPWNPNSGAIVDLDGTLDAYLRKVVTRANVGGFTQITIQVDYLPSNWDTFDPWTMVTQRNQLQTSSINAANNIIARLRTLGLNTTVVVTSLNNYSVPSRTAANGIRFGAGAKDSPAIKLIMR